jgi:hypothetical protein
VTRFVLPEIAHQMELIPLLWLAVLRLRGRKLDPAWWWLAGAFFVSWLADSAAHGVDPDLAGNIYPVVQAALVGAVFLDRLEALQFLTALAIVAVVAVLWRGPLGVDVLLRTVAWGGAVGVVVDRWALGRLRTALLVAFGLSLVAWWVFAAWPSLPTWLVYKAAWTTGMILFCRAALQPGPRFSLIRRGA